MNSDSNKLLPAYRRFYKTPVKGKRTVISIALDQPKISAKSNVNLTSQNYRRTCALTQTPFTYRLCLRTPTRSRGLRTISEDFCVMSFR